MLRDAQVDQLRLDVWDSLGSLRQNTNPGIRPVFFKQFAHRRLNRPARLEHGCANLFISQVIGIHEDVCFSLDLRLDLCLPLVLFLEPRGADGVQQVLRIPSLAQQLAIQSMLGDAIPTFRGDDDGPTWLHNLRCCAHALDCLIQVQVQWVSGIGRNNDIKGLLDRDHRSAFSKRAARGMGFVQLAGKNAGDLLMLVQGNVDYELDS